MAGPWDNYQAQPATAGPWENYGAPPPTATPPGAVTRFLTGATGLPIEDILAHPNAYLNPFSDEFKQGVEANKNQTIKAPTAAEMTPGRQTYEDIKAKNYAGAAGDVLPTALTLASLAGGGFGNAGQPEILPPNAVPPRLTGEVAPAAIPRAAEPAPAPYRYGPGSVTPDATGPTTPAGANAVEGRPLSANTQVLGGNQGTIVRPLRMLNGEAQPPEAAPAPAGSYRNLSDLNGRADYLDDQAVIEGMRKDLYMQAKAGGRQAREEFEAGNSMDKPKYVRQAEAEAQQIMDKASQLAQQHVQDTIDRFNRPVTGKSGAQETPTTTKPQDLEATLRKSIEQAQAAKTQPVRVDFDEEGNVSGADGRHRVIEAVKRGDKTMPVQVKLADGSTQTLQLSPATVAKRMGVTPESLEATDAQQAEVSGGKVRH